MGNTCISPEEFFLDFDVNGILLRDANVLYALKNAWNKGGVEEDALALVLAHLYPEICNQIEFMSYDKMLETMLLSDQLSNEFKKTLELLFVYGQLDMSGVESVQDIEEQMYLSWVLKIMSPSTLFDFNINQYINYLLIIEQQQNILYRMGFEANHEYER